MAQINEQTAGWVENTVRIFSIRYYGNLYRYKPGKFAGVLLDKRGIVFLTVKDVP